MVGNGSQNERSARERLSQSQCHVGWSLRISRTPLGFELSGSVRIFGHDAVVSIIITLDALLESAYGANSRLVKILERLGGQQFAASQRPVLRKKATQR